MDFPCLGAANPFDAAACHYYIETASQRQVARLDLFFRGWYGIFIMWVVVESADDESGSFRCGLVIQNARACNQEEFSQEYGKVPVPAVLFGSHHQRRKGRGARHGGESQSARVERQDIVQLRARQRRRGRVSEQVCRARQGSSACEVGDAAGVRGSFACRRLFNTQSPHRRLVQVHEAYCPSQEGSVVDVHIRGSTEIAPRL